jgi:hypothetical protein
MLKIAIIVFAALVNMFVFLLMRTAVGFVMIKPMSVVMTDPIMLMILLGIVVGIVVCMNHRNCKEKS